MAENSNKNFRVHGECITSLEVLPRVLQCIVGDLATKSPIHMCEDEKGNQVVDFQKYLMEFDTLIKKQDEAREAAQQPETLYDNASTADSIFGGTG